MTIAEAQQAVATARAELLSIERRSNVARLDGAHGEAMAALHLAERALTKVREQEPAPDCMTCRDTETVMMSMTNPDEVAYAAPFANPCPACRLVEALDALGYRIAT